MRKLIITLVSIALSSFAYAQQMHEAFKKETELMMAVKSFDYSALAADVVVFEFDTLHQEVDVAGLNKLIKNYLVPGKQQTFRKAAETNNGYIQTIGLYTKTDDAVMYIRFEFDPLTSKLIEVVLERNR
jgi:hypothetical protein